MHLELRNEALDKCEENYVLLFSQLNAQINSVKPIIRTSNGYGFNYKKMKAV